VASNGKRAHRLSGTERPQDISGTNPPVRRKQRTANSHRFIPGLQRGGRQPPPSRPESVAKEGRDPALEQRRARAGVSAPRTLGDLIAEYLRRREGQVAAKTLKIERDLQGVLAAKLGDRLIEDLEPVDFGKAVADYAARLRAEGRSNGTNANKVLAASRRMFKFARGWGLISAIDPTAGLVRRSGTRRAIECCSMARPWSGLIRALTRQGGLRPRSWANRQRSQQAAQLGSFLPTIELASLARRLRRFPSESARQSTKAMTAAPSATRWTPSSARASSRSGGAGI
jgi:hypothetical protein